MKTIANNKIIHGDALTYARSLPDESVNCIVTSPPYYGLRDYGVSGQIGLEESPEEYIERLVVLFRELRRALKNDGTLWLNLGDSYGGNSTTKSKQLLGIPWRVALALQADGWILRSDIIWHKPCPMPESVTDRPTKSHEYVFLMSKAGRYYYDADAIREKAIVGKDLGLLRGNPPQKHALVSAHVRSTDKRIAQGVDSRTAGSGLRNKRTVWTITPKPYSGAHFAVFPEKLIEPMILAGCPTGGVVCDPFMGSGTTALVARRLKRTYTGSELNKDYIEMAIARLAMGYTPDMFE